MASGRAALAGAVGGTQLASIELVRWSVVGGTGEPLGAVGELAKRLQLISADVASVL